MKSIARHARVLVFLPVFLCSCATSAVKIVGFYGAANDGGTFVRSVDRAPVSVGDKIVVSGTGYYDGTWIVQQAFPYKDPRDSRELWGYRIAAKWRGMPPGFTVEGGVPSDNEAKLLPLGSR